MRARIAATALALWLALSSEAQAETEADRAAAAALADRALDRYDHGDYKESLELFGKASTLARTPTFALYEARSLVRLGRLPEAEAAYERAIQLDSGPAATPVQQQAVTDARVERAAIRRRREEATAPPVAEKPRTVPPSRGPSKATVAVLAVGGTGLVVGVAWGALMLSHKSTLDSGCAGGQCPASQRDELDGFRSARLISSLGWGVGLVGLGVGAGLWISGSGTSSPQAAGVRFLVGPTGASAIGTF